MATKINPQALAKIIALKAAMSGGRPGMPPQGMPPGGAPQGPPPGMKKGGKVGPQVWGEKGREKPGKKKENWDEEGVEKKHKFAGGGSIKANGPKMGIESKGKTRVKIY